MAHMTKKVKQVQGAAATQQSDNTTAVTQQYKVLAPKGRLHEKTKYGAEGSVTFAGQQLAAPSGTAGTHATLAWAAQLNGGTLTDAQGMAICAARGDKGFWGYAKNPKKLGVVVPV